MKNLILVSFLFFVSCLSYFSQKVITSISLDSAIYQQINVERKERNISELTKFLYGDIRDFSKKVTESNCGLTYFQHSNIDSMRKYANSECIYQHKIIFGNTSFYDVNVNKNSINKIAKEVVDAWLNSPSHKQAILFDESQKITITSQIKFLSDKQLVVSVSYHSVYNTKKIKNSSK